jgi:hypothetical protein
MSDKAQEIIAMRDMEVQKLSNWKPMWQDASDLVYPREDQIMAKTMAGEDKSRKRIDSTAVESSKLMASGLAASLNVTTGQKFFGFKAVNPSLSENNNVGRWCWLATQLLHEALYASNIILHIVQSFRSLVVFGTNCIYSEWDAAGGQLNFKDHAISTYTIKENNHGDVDTVILTYKFTARQVIQEFGKKNVSKKILEDASSLKSESKKFEFIRIVRPRTDLNPLFEDNKNMPFECVNVDVDAIDIVHGVNDEGYENETGYEEFPFHVARWEKGATEKYGRGQGTDNISDIRMLQQQLRDFNDVCEKKGFPALEILESFEGTVNLSKGAQNFVREKGTINPVNPNATGELQAMWQAIQEQRKLIKGYFYQDVFTPITQLEGTHRTALEIEQRRQEGLRLLAAPVMNIQSELLTPLIMRCVMLLIRNGRIPQPPLEMMKVTGRSKTSIEVEIDKKQLGIEYIGPLALALSNQAAQGSEGWVGMLSDLAKIKPDALDYVNWDNAIPRWAQARGVNVADVATAEQIAAIREERAKQMQMQQAAQMAETAGKTYKDASGAPEQGSPAEQLMGAMK